ncbi:hypothetical protein AVEN_89444-1 [Araneus ventricosus]|uniref:Uncharacterized protein n=1 Tax=Araneus ventricosus TaxID=182803 RepID=A0A4Y2DSX6_ARAVE|nr:hypothetical protein AVEN_255512-1 [Araneus ventricosus]GBM19143.1 hypothetical protein AVEN_22453-1 [Araneus ventricosus]GBM19146.1 hypothetical protein AVEN_75557-1 [Araneus ventricosus]GBM19150.1 hypothetical protein AVEN_89444-1 [Araneus ventricosus]
MAAYTQSLLALPLNTAWRNITRFTIKMADPRMVHASPEKKNVTDLSPPPRRRVACPFEKGVSLKRQLADCPILSKRQPMVYSALERGSQQTPL